MIMKSILAATAVAATLAAAAPAAEAHHHHIHLNIGIGLGDPGYGYPPPPPVYAPPPPPAYYPPPPPPRYYDPSADYADSYGISCGEGRQIVRESGFYHVRTVECDGQNFKYTGYRHGNSYIIKVDSESGDILGARPY